MVLLGLDGCGCLGAAAAAALTRRQQVGVWQRRWAGGGDVQLGQGLGHDRERERGSATGREKRGIGNRLFLSLKIEWS
jgi:hypothetical protein